MGPPWEWARTDGETQTSRNQTLGETSMKDIQEIKDQRDTQASDEARGDTDLKEVQVGALVEVEVGGGGDGTPMALGKK